MRKFAAGAWFAGLRPCTRFVAVVNGLVWALVGVPVILLGQSVSFTEYPLPCGGGIVTGPDGALWFTEGSAGKIGRITTAGVITEYPLQADTFPGSIATGPDGALWFAVFAGDSGIERITTTGVITKFARQPPGPSPDSITTGPDGALWLTDGYAVGRALLTYGNVTVMTAPAGLSFTVDGASYNGSASFNWSAGQSHSIGVTTSPESGAPGTRYPFATWSDGGAQIHSILVPLSQTTYTAFFTTQYLLTTSVAPPGSGGISVNPSSPDGFYDAGTSVQATATPNSGFQFSNWSSDLSGTINPQSLTMSAPHSVQANFGGLAQSTSFSEYPTLTSGSYPLSITAGPDGALWFTEGQGDKIGRITTAGVITEYLIPTSGSNPMGIATGADRALWFTEFDGNRIGRITAAGVITEYPIPTNNGKPASITTGPDGALWFTEYNGNKIGRITTAGVITEYPIPTNNISPYGITTGPDGALWFTEYFGSKIGRITTAGVIAEYTVPTNNSYPARITTGPDGALWFTETLVSKIGRITTAGVITEYPLPTNKSSPYGITAGPDGALWFAAFRSIGRITTAGVISEYPFPDMTTEIATGPDGALWFTAGQGQVLFPDEIGRLVLPTGIACTTYSLPQSSQAFSSGGGNGVGTLRAPAGAPAGCTWTASSGVPWVTITSGSTGAGNGTVSYTVSANPSTSARSGTLTIAGQTYTVTQAGSTASLNCTGSVPSAPQVAIEGRTELLGDFVLSCFGLTGTVKADITLTSNTNVTNSLANGATDAVLAVNGGSAQNGLVGGYNSLRWPGVLLVPAGNGTASARISKVRADATPLLTQRATANPGNPQPTAITGQVSVSAVPVSGALQTMANAVQTMVFTENSPVPPTGGTQTSIPMVFQEAQAISFQASATRLRMSLSNVPGTVQVYVPVYPVEGAARAQLYSADVNGAGGGPVAGSPFAGGTYQLLTANGGTVTATWVVLAADPSVIETFTFPLLVLNAASGDLNAMQVSGSLAPVSTVSIPSATAPVPRYRDFSAQPSLTNLRVSSSVQGPGGGAAAFSLAGREPAARPPALQEGVLTGSKEPVGNAKSATGGSRADEGIHPTFWVPVPHIVGSNATFTNQVVNDTSDAGQTATNVIIRNNVPSGLNVASCQATGGATCTPSGNQAVVNVGTLGPGQTATVTVVAQVDPSFTGAALETPVSASSDQVNLDLLASTSSSSFLVNGSANLGVSSTHIGSFVQGQPTAAYTLSVQNLGAAPTAGAVSVTDTLPAGLTATAINGPGWACTLATLTCSRSDALPAGSTYPPITVTVSVAANAASPVTNQVSASGGGSATATASDSTTIIPAFTDIPASDSSFIPFIDLLQQSGITKGCQDSPPMYCSTDPIPESQMAVFVIRSVMGNDNFAYTPTPYFTDVPASYLYFPWIQKMQDLGIGLPCAQTLYCPESAVTRGIMSVLIVRSRFGVSIPTNYPTTPFFTDVPATHPYFPWIQKMKQLGITTGCSPTTYCPDDPVTRGQMAVFIMRGEFNQGLQDPNTPVLVWISPASASPGQMVTATIVGRNTNFSGATQVNAGSGITVSSISVANATTLTAQFSVTPGATLGPRSITVTTGGEEATLPNGFRAQ